MANLNDLRSQLEVANELNKALERQISLQNSLISGASKQAQIMTDICKTGAKCTGNEKAQAAGQRELQKEIEKTKKTQRDMGNEMARGAKKAEKAVGGMKGAFSGLKNFLFSWKGMVTGLFAGLVGGVAKIFSGLVGVVKGVFSAITSVVKVGMGLIKGLIMAPFSMMNMMNDAANRVHQLGVIINGAVQAVNGMIGAHKELGTVTGDAYKVALKAVKTLPGGVFGPREQGAAERIKLAGELVQAFGPYMSTLKDLSREGAKFAVRMKKSLGFTDEEFQNLIATSKHFGKDINAEFKEVSLTIANLASTTGLNIKTMGREFMTFHTKLKPLTGATTAQIGRMTAVFGKLGIKADKALSMFDKFETLEGGAEVVMKLSRTMGIQLSQSEMIMSRGDPLKQMKLVQEAMLRSGKTFENLSYDGKKMITEMFGGDQQAAMKAFGEEGIRSADSIEKAAKAAQKARDAKSVPKLLQKIDQSIQGAADSLGRIFKPLEAFFEGFIRTAFDGNFVQNMATMSNSFMDIGREVGRIAKSSGLIQFLTKGLANFAKDLRNIMPDVRDLVDALFNPNSNKSVFEVLGNISDKVLAAYGDFYGDMTKMIIKISGKVIPIVLKMIAFLGEALNTMLVSIMDPNKSFMSLMSGKFSSIFDSMDVDSPGIKAAADEAGKNISDAAAKAFGPENREVFNKKTGKFMTQNLGLGDALGTNLLEGLRRIGDKLAELFGEVFLKGMSYLWTNYKTEIILIGGAYLFGPMILKGLVSALSSTAVLGALKSAGTYMLSAAGTGLAAIGGTTVGAGVAGSLGVGATAAGGIVAGSVLAAGAAGYAVGTLIDEQLGLSDAIGDYFAGVGSKSREQLKTEEEKNNKYFARRRDRLKKMKFETKTEQLFDEYTKNLKKANSPAALKVLAQRIELDQTMAENEKKVFREKIKNKRADVEMKMKVAASEKRATGIVQGRSADIRQIYDAVGIGQGGIAKIVETKRGRDNVRFGGTDAQGEIGTSVLRSTLDIAAGYQATVMEQGQALTKMLNEAAAPGGMGIPALINTPQYQAALTAQQTAQAAQDNIFEVNKIPKAQRQFLIDLLGESINTTIDRGSTFRTKTLASDAGFMATRKLFVGQVDRGKQRDEKRILDLAQNLLEKPTSAAALKAVADLKLSEEQLKKYSLESFIPKLKSAASAVGVAVESKKKVDAAGAGPKSAVAEKAKAQGKKAAKKKSIRVQKLDAAERLSKLPVSVLKLLAKKGKAQMMIEGASSIEGALSAMLKTSESTSTSLKANAVPALQATATAAETATGALAGTVIMLDYVRDRMAQIQTIYSGIATSVVRVRRAGGRLYGKSTLKIAGEGGKLTVNMHVSVDSRQISGALRRTPTVTWTGAMNAKLPEGE